MIIPLVSICIPTYNNEKTIFNCLNSIVEQKGVNFEIIIVDGGSTDNTLIIAKEFTEKIYFDYGLLGSARQKSLEMSNGEIIGLFDSDIVLPHNRWLINAVEELLKEERTATVWPLNAPPPWGGPVANIYFKHWAIIMKDRIKNNRGLIGGGNSLFKKSVLLEIGGINRDLHWGEDYDWAGKIKNIGYDVKVLDDYIFHDTMNSFKMFYKKQFTGAETFTKTGFELMEMSFYWVIYEQLILGTYGMFKGLFIEHDKHWLLFPLMSLTKIIAYTSKYVFR